MFNSIAFNSIKTKLIPTFFGFIFMIISSRIVGPKKVGDFVIYLILYNLLKLIGEGGFSLILSDKKYTLSHLYASNLHYFLMAVVGCVVISLMNIVEFGINVIIIQLSLIAFCVQTYYQNDLKMNLKYSELSEITFFAALITISISLILIFFIPNDTILYLRYFLLEILMLLLLKQKSRIKYKFGQLKHLLQLYPKSIHFLLHGLFESIVEFFLVNSLHSTVSSSTVGYYNRSNQFVDAGVKSPIQGFRAAYIGLITGKNLNTIKEIMLVFSFMILSTLLILFIVLFGKEIILFVLGKEWISILDWLGYAILVGWAFAFEQLASTNMYLIKKHKFILFISFIIKIPLVLFIFRGFDLFGWSLWSIIYFFSTLIYLIITTFYTLNEYRNSNNLDV